MKFFSRQNFLLLLVTTLVVTACNPDKAEKDQVDPAPVNAEFNPCKLTKIKQDGIVWENIYDSNDRIIRTNNFDRNNQLFSFRTYTYNQAGKAATEIYHEADSTIVGRQVYTYNDKSLLVRIDFIGHANEYYYPSPDHVIMHYDNAGKRIRADFYNHDQPNLLAYYFEYTYSQQTVYGNWYDATTLPATFKGIWEFHFDDKKSIFHALGYLNAMIPDYEKHNLLYSNRPIDYGATHIGNTYQYNNWDYPVMAYPFANFGIDSEAIVYEYVCQ